MKEKLDLYLGKIRDFFLNIYKKLNIKITPVNLALILFAIFFVLDIFALRFLTNTGYVIACVLLVIEVAMAALLAQSNYGVLGGVAVAQLIVGFFAKEIPAVLFSLIIYFLTLGVIHVMRKHGGEKK